MLSVIGKYSIIFQLIKNFQSTIISLAYWIRIRNYITGNTAYDLARFTNLKW